MSKGVEMKHDIPINDKFKHKQSMFCKCEPAIDHKQRIVTHRVVEHDKDWDKR